MSQTVEQIRCFVPVLGGNVPEKVLKSAVFKEQVAANMRVFADCFPGNGQVKAC